MSIKALFKKYTVLIGDAGGIHDLILIYSRYRVFICVSICTLYVHLYVNETRRDDGRAVTSLTKPSVILSV